MNPVVHFEIPVDNVARAKKFYTELFGWKIQKMEMPKESSTQGEPYYMVIATKTDKQGMVQTPGAINGGMMKRVNPGQPFMNYLSVDNIDVMLKKIKAKGGTICLPKTEIAKGMGWIACFLDTEGNMLGLHQVGAKHQTAKKKK